VVEQSTDMIGGSCINIACVPIKILIHDAAERRDSDHVDEYFAAAVARRDSLTAAIRQTNYSLLRQLDSVLLVSGRAAFTGEREVRVAGGGDNLQITADAVVVNTGSAPQVPPSREPRSAVISTRRRRCNASHPRRSPFSTGANVRWPPRTPTSPTLLPGSYATTG